MDQVLTKVHVFFRAFYHRKCWTKLGLKLDDTHCALPFFVVETRNIKRLFPAKEAKTPLLSESFLSLPPARTGGCFKWDELYLGDDFLLCVC
jgi:hypothetical protein